MKKIFKLAAIAVSMALVTSLVACSSGDDDVVDTSTGEYLLTEQIGRYIESINNYADSIVYDQNVSDAEIESLEKAHEKLMGLIGNCTDCLEAYYSDLKELAEGSEDIPLTSTQVKDSLKMLNWCSTEEKSHKIFIYIPAIKDALDEVWAACYKVSKIGDPAGDTILNKALNERQTASMKACTDAVAALKAALNNTDKTLCKDTIKDADDAIKVFNDLKNKDVTKVEVSKVATAVYKMYGDINTNVYDKFWTEYNK